MAPDFNGPDPGTRALCEFVDRGQADILVVPGCSRPQAFASREPELEALLGAVTCDLRIVPRSPVDSSTVTRFAVAFGADSANRQP